MKESLSQNNDQCMTLTGRRNFIVKVLTGSTAILSAGAVFKKNSLCLSGQTPFSPGLHGNEGLLPFSCSSHSSEPGIANDSRHRPAAFQGTEAKFYSLVESKRLRCDLCFRNCLINEGDTGFCRVRKNVEGKLYSMVYGRPAGLQIDPIEMEPMYHMFPGHQNLCVFTASCNFRCRHCHNWHISQRGPDEVASKELSPDEVVETAINKRCRSISHSINEPAVFYEYMYDIASIAKERGLMTLFHTNGYLNEMPLRDLLKYMDSVTVDLKAFTDRFYREISSASLEPVLNSLKIIKEENVHLEIVNLVIPTLNDDADEIRSMCVWIRDELGDTVPLHFNRFTPIYKLSGLSPTPVRTLERSAGIAFDTGLKYVYIGNLPGHKHNSTYCPSCGERLIYRTHISVLENNIDKGRCNSCGYHIEGIWEETV